MIATESNSHFQNMEEATKHLNELLSIYFRDKSGVFSYNSSDLYPLTFKIESTQGIGIFSIEKGDYLEGSLSEHEIDSTFRFYTSYRDYIIEAWNKHRFAKEPSIIQNRYRINLYNGVFSKITISKFIKPDYYELYYAFSPKTKLYSIKGLVGTTIPGKAKHLKIVFKMIFELEDFHSTMNDKISKKIVIKLKIYFLTTFIINYKLSKNRSIKPEILQILLKLKPAIYKQDDFDQETINNIKEKGSFWFSSYHKIRLNCNSHDFF